MDPHSIACFLFDSAQLVIPQPALDKFWSHHQEFHEPWAMGVDYATIPMGVYGDSARVATKFGSINLAGIYFNLVLWKPQSVRASRFLLFAIPEEKLWGHHTLNCVYRRITWSLNSLVEGIHPAKGPYGESLPPHLEKLASQAMSKRYALTEIRGDWSWHKKLFRFHRCSWNGLNICHHCRAKSASDNPAELYWTFENNTWETCPFTLVEFINERLPPQGICFLFCFVRILFSVCNSHASTMRACIFSAYTCYILCFFQYHAWLFRILHCDVKPGVSLCYKYNSQTECFCNSQLRYI